MSAMGLPKADSNASISDVAVGPILLKKSIEVTDQIFSASWKRFSN